MTSFFRVADVDDLATKAGVSIATGDEHDLALSFDGTIREVRSDPVDLQELSDGGARLFADIFSIRVDRALRAWKPLLRDNWNAVDRDQIDWKNLFDAFLVVTAQYFGVQLSELERLVQNGTFEREDAQTLQNGREELARRVRGTLREFVGGDNVQIRGANAQHILAESNLRGMHILEEMGRYRRLFDGNGSRWLEEEWAEPKTTLAWEMDEGAIPLPTDLHDAPIDGISYSLF